MVGTVRRKIAEGTRAVGGRTGVSPGASPYPEARDGVGDGQSPGRRHWRGGRAS